METILSSVDEVFDNREGSLQRLLEQTEGLIYQFRYCQETNQYSFPFASIGLCALYEVTPEQVKHDATPALRRVHKVDLKNVLQLMHKSMETMEIWSCDYRVILPSKGERWLRGHGRPLKLEDGSYLWNGYVNDITEQKKTEINLIESQHRLQLAVEVSQNGVWDWDLKTDKVYYSKESIKMLGYQPYEVESTAKIWLNKVHPEDRTQYRIGVKEHFCGKSDYYSSEYRVLSKNGKYLWIQDRGKVIERDEDGTVLRVIGTHTDISRLKQKEEEDLKKLNVIGEQNSRLLNFAHIVSHNLRSHAGNFKMLIELINDTKDVDDKLEMIDYLKNVSDSLTDTIANLTAVVSVQTDINSQLIRVNLKTYIEKALTILKGDIKDKEATIINEISPNIFINYNPAYLESILLNLLSNALKYKHPDRDPKITLKTMYRDHRLVLQISDNGIGIDLDMYGHKIFGMYETFNGNSDATGIGLFITKNQIDAMGGEIKVSSEVNVGTNFEIVFDTENSSFDD